MVWAQSGQVRHLSPLPWRRTTGGSAEVEVPGAQVGDLLHACPGVVEEQEQGVVAQGVPPGPGKARGAGPATSSRSRKCVSAGAARFIGMAATRWQTPSISGSRVAM